MTFAASRSAGNGFAAQLRAVGVQGSDSGPAIVPGNLQNSLLIEAVRYENTDLQMPPEPRGRLVIVDHVSISSSTRTPT